MVKLINNKSKEIVEFPEFKEFYHKMTNVHKRCGDICIHLKRFYMRLGFTSLKFSNRRVIKQNYY